VRLEKNQKYPLIYARLSTIYSSQTTRQISIKRSVVDVQYILSRHFYFGFF